MSWIAISDQDRETLHPKLIHRLESATPAVPAAVLSHTGGFKIGNGMRSPELQGDYYARGRNLVGYGDQTHRSIVSNAPPGSSFHNWGLAVDLAPVKGIWTYLDGGRFYSLRGSNVANVREAWENTGIPQALRAQGLTWGADFTTIFDPEHFHFGGWVPTDPDMAGVPWWTFSQAGVSYTDPATHPMSAVWKDSHPPASSSGGSEDGDTFGDMPAGEAADLLERARATGKLGVLGWGLLFAALWLLGDGNYQKLKRGVERELRKVVG